MIKQTVLLQAFSNVDECELHDSDTDVPGSYLIDFDELPAKQHLADAALDVFHSQVAIKVLEDFSFEVFQGFEYLEESDNDESYTFTGSATVIKFSEGIERQ